MALGDLSFDTSAVKTRLGRVFVSDDDGTTWIEVGRCQDVKLNFNKVVTPMDQNGREKQLAVDVVGTYVLTQTSDTELANVDALVHPSGQGLWMKFTDVTATTATADAAAGSVVKNVLNTFEGELDFGGGNSFLSFEFKGRVSIDGFVALGGASTELVFG